MKVLMTNFAHVRLGLLVMLQNKERMRFPASGCLAKGLVGSACGLSASPVFTWSHLTADGTSLRTTSLRSASGHCPCCTVDCRGPEVHVNTVDL